MVYAQVGRGRLHLVGSRRGNNGHCVSPGEVGFHQGAGFGVDQAGDLLVIQFLTQLPVGLFLYAPHELGVDSHHGREAEAAEAETGHGAQQLDEFLRRQVSPPDLLADKGGGGITGDDGAVEIEDCRDPRPAGRGFDILQQLFNCGHCKLPRMFREHNA